MVNFLRGRRYSKPRPNGRASSWTTIALIPTEGPEEKTVRSGTPASRKGRLTSEAHQVVNTRHEDSEDATHEPPRYERKVSSFRLQGSKQSLHSEGIYRHIGIILVGDGRANLSIRRFPASCERSSATDRKGTQGATHSSISSSASLR